MHILHTHPATGVDCTHTHTKEHEAEPTFATCGGAHPISRSWYCPIAVAISSSPSLLLLLFFSLGKNHLKQHFSNAIRIRCQCAFRLSILYRLLPVCVLYSYRRQQKSLIDIQNGRRIRRFYYYVFTVWSQLFGFIRFVLLVVYYVRPKSRKKKTKLAFVLPQVAGHWRCSSHITGGAIVKV